MCAQTERHTYTESATAAPIFEPRAYLSLNEERNDFHASRTTVVEIIPMPMYLHNIHSR